MKPHASRPATMLALRSFFPGGRRPGVPAKRMRRTILSAARRRLWLPVGRRVFCLIDQTRFNACLHSPLAERILGSAVAMPLPCAVTIIHKLSGAGIEVWLAGGGGLMRCWGTSGVRITILTCWCLSRKVSTDSFDRHFRSWVFGSSRRYNAQGSHGPFLDTSASVTVRAIWWMSCL